jgi:hypothetical protein
MFRRRLRLIVFSLALVAALAVPVQVASAAASPAHHIHPYGPCPGGVPSC